MVEPRDRKTAGGGIGLTQRLDLLDPVAKRRTIQRIDHFVQPGQRAALRLVFRQRLQPVNRDDDDRHVLQGLADRRLALPKPLGDHFRVDVAQQVLVVLCLMLQCRLALGQPVRHAVEPLGHGTVFVTARALDPRLVFAGGKAFSDRHDPP